MGKFSMSFCLIEKTVEGERPSGLVKYEGVQAGDQATALAAVRRAARAHLAVWYNDPDTHELVELIFDPKGSKTFKESSKTFEKKGRQLFAFARARADELFAEAPLEEVEESEAPADIEDDQAGGIEADIATLVKANSKDELIQLAEAEGVATSGTKADIAARIVKGE